MDNVPAPKPAAKPPKLARLPKGAKIQKRPLLHPQIASTRAGATTPKVVYVSASSPFIATVKRVRKYLEQIDKRAMGKVSLLDNDNGNEDDRERVRKMGRGREQAGKEEVLVKGTGKAIDRCLQIGLYFQGQEDCDVRLRTGSVGAIDDVVATGEGGLEGDEAVVEETRVRRTSVLEVGVRLR